MSLLAPSQTLLASDALTVKSRYFMRQRANFQGHARPNVSIFCDSSMLSPLALTRKQQTYSLLLENLNGCFGGR